MKKKVLVTGGAGFIGSNLVEKLVGQGYLVTVLDNFSAKKGLLKDVENSIKIVNANMLDEQLVREVAKDQDYIVHLAALKSVDESLANPVASAKGNVLGIVNLLTALTADKEKAAQKRFIFASTAAVYGYNSNFPLKENEQPDPQSPYALEKVVGEQYLALFHKLYGVESISLRFFNVYGPRQYSAAPHCGGVTIVMKELLESKQSTLLGDGLQTRDMIYVGDVVDSVIAAMTTPNKLTGEICNVCTGTRVTVKDVHEMVAEAMGLKGQNGYKSVPFADGNVVHSMGDPQKAAKLLHFEARVPLREGIQQTWEWYRLNDNFYNS